MEQFINKTMLYALVIIVMMIQKSDQNEIYAIYKECFTVGFNNHIKGYILLLPHKNAPEKQCKLSVNNFLRPFRIHVNAKGQNVVSRRDLR